jgi:hypothetical protein
MLAMIDSISTNKDIPMSALPVYEVEFIPMERRLGDRRVAPRDAALPASITADRRKTPGRRPEDRQVAPLKAI